MCHVPPQLGKKEKLTKKSEATTIIHISKSILIFHKVKFSKSIFTYCLLNIINFADPRITKLQSQIHPKCDKGWGSSKPILPTGHWELLEEQWQSL